MLNVDNITIHNSRLGSGSNVTIVPSSDTVLWLLPARARITTYNVQKLLQRGARNLAVKILNSFQIETVLRMMENCEERYEQKCGPFFRTKKPLHYNNYNDIV